MLRTIAWVSALGWTVFLLGLLLTGQFVVALLFLLVGGAVGYAAVGAGQYVSDVYEYQRRVREAAFLLAPATQSSAATTDAFALYDAAGRVLFSKPG